MRQTFSSFLYDTAARAEGKVAQNAESERQEILLQQRGVLSQAFRNCDGYEIINFMLQQGPRRIETTHHLTPVEEACFKLANQYPSALNLSIKQLS